MPRDTRQGQCRVIAGELAENVGRAIRQPDCRVEEEDDLNQPLEQQDPGVPSSHVHELVQEGPRELLPRKSIDQPWRNQQSRPYQAPDGRCCNAVCLQDRDRVPEPGEGGQVCWIDWQPIRVDEPGTSEPSGHPDVRRDEPRQQARRPRRPRPASAMPRGRASVAMRRTARAWPAAGKTTVRSELPGLRSPSCRA